MKPISRTAFYCCGVRMLDAESSSPLCGDTYARLFMNEEALEFLEEFKDETGPNLGNVTRHRLIDDHLRQELLDNPALRVIIIGAGFDTRAYRLKGGSWVELDEPQVIAYKDERLPASEAENQLQRIPIDFATDLLAEKLAPFSTGEPVATVVEGVLAYLEESQIRELLQTLGRLFSKNKLLCDMMTRDFFINYSQSIHEKIAGLGAPFKFIRDDPAAIFLESGYKLADKIPVVEKVVEFTRPDLTEEQLKSLPQSLPKGYDIYVFEFTGESQ